MKNQRTLLLWVGIAILLSISGCIDKTEIIPDDAIEHPTNRPPKILLSGPVYDSSAHFKNLLPQPWVIVGDSDGPNDIATVVLNVSSIKLVSIIVRPDDSTQPCSTPFYAPMDTINVLPYLKKQTFSIPNQALQQGGNGVYTAYLSYSLLTEGGLVNDANVFGQVVKSCRSGYDYLYMIEHFGLYPPALPSARDVYVTYVEFLISGISITVYDQSGASATVTFPDFYGVFSNSTEDQIPP
jgi:hypothetical protein